MFSAALPPRRLSLLMRLEIKTQANPSRSWIGGSSHSISPRLRKAILGGEHSTLPVLPGKVRNDQGVSAVACELCKSPLEQRPSAFPTAAHAQRVSLQRRESGLLLDSRVSRKLEALSREVPQLENQLRELETTYRTTAAEWIRRQSGRRNPLILRLGELKQRLVQLGEYQQLAAVIEELQEESLFGGTQARTARQIYHQTRKSR